MDDQLDDPSEDLTAEVTVAEGTAVVCLSGEIDIATREIVAAACTDAIAAGVQGVVVGRKVWQRPEDETRWLIAEMAKATRSASSRAASAAE